MTTYLPSVIVGTSRNEVLRELRRRSAAGELHSAGPGIEPILRGPHAGQYAIPVYLRAVQRPRRSPVRRIVACTVIGVIVAGTLIWWVLSTLSATALAALLITLLVTFSYGARRATRVDVTTTTTTRVTIR